MKINFDSLLLDENPKNQKILQSTFSFKSTETKHQLSTYSILTQDVSPQRKNTILKNADEVKNLLESKMQEILKSKDSISYVQFAKKKKTINVKQLTERIYQPPTCNKKYCKQLQLQKTKQQILDYLQTTKQFRANQSFYKMYEEGNVYERLHNQSKLRKFRIYRDNNFMIESKHSTVLQGSKKYLKNYIPFYDRLQTIISKSQEKKKFLQTNPQLDFSSTQKYFTPALIKNQQYKGVKPRYMEDLCSSRQGHSYKFQESLNTSFESIASLDKSVQLVNDIQNYFFNRMECIFVNWERGQVGITQQNITLLSNIQFKIMQDFIIDLQSNPIEPQFFIDKLQTYYKHLDFRDKQELRIHQSKLKKYSKRNKQQMKQKKKQSNLSKPPSKTSKNFEKDLLFV